MLAGRSTSTRGGETPALPNPAPRYPAASLCRRCQGDTDLQAASWEQPSSLPEHTLLWVEEGGRKSKGMKREHEAASLSPPGVVESSLPSSHHQQRPWEPHGIAR